MIINDQPTIFGDALIAAVSSVGDGNMSFKQGDLNETLKNRERFLAAADIQPENTTLVQVTFEGVTDFARYTIVTDDDKGRGMFEPVSDLPADALVTTQPGHALFLPLADCTGVILYDVRQRILMVSHIGRHSAEIDGAQLSVEYLAEQFATDPRDVKVWLSPAVGKATYPLHKKNGRSLHEVILEQLSVAGVPAENIEASPINTAISEGYFSHSEFLAGNRSSNGRFAIVAQMREQGEPAS